MKKIVMLTAFLGAWMAHAQETKNLYGQTFTREQFEEDKQYVRPNPKWKAGEAGVRERIKELKKRSAGRPPEYAEQPIFDEKASLAVIPRLKEEAASFYVHTMMGESNISLLLNPEPLAFDQQLQVVLVSATLRLKDEQKVEVKNLRPEYWSWSKNGRSFGRYAFPLPGGLKESDVDSGEAVVELSLPKGFETVTLTKQNPKANGFEIVEHGSHFIRVKYDRPDGSEFIWGVLTQDDKPLISYPLGEGKLSLVVELLKKKWEEIPATVTLPATGTIDIGFVGPATKVLLYKPTGNETHRVKSVWKEMP